MSYQSFNHHRSLSDNNFQSEYPLQSPTSTHNYNQQNYPTSGSNNQWAQAPAHSLSSDSSYKQEYNQDGFGPLLERVTVRPGRGGFAGFSSNPSQPHEQIPRRTLTLGASGQGYDQAQSRSAMSDAHHYGAPPSYSSNDNVAIHLQPSTPQYPQHPSAPPSIAIPGSLQPGLSNRPGPMSSNTDSQLQTLPQISTQLQQASMSVRPMANSAHSYSRSSPGNMDSTKYKPFSGEPESSKLTTPTSYVTQTPHGPSYSPLGLADIRPRADQGFPDINAGAGVAPDTDVLQYPTNSSYVASWPIYAADWCKWPPASNGNGFGKVAIGSYLEDNHNYIQILDAQQQGADHEGSQSETGLTFTKTAEATHAYPVTRILWEPPSSNKQTTDLLATSGDHLRLWSLPNDPYAYQSNSINRQNPNQPLQKLSPLALLSNSKSPEHTAPITSLDWNIVQPSLIITSSIDTTCTIWDIPTLTAKTQLIAHDKEVFDVRFCAASVDVFVSCGADGSVRMFDLRSLEHSTIIYEPSEKADKSSQFSSDTSSPTRQTLSFPPPLLRIAASPHDAHLLATFSQDSSIIRVLDVRQPGQALLELKGHGANVNCMEWCSTQRGLLASGADDSTVMLWDLLGSSATGGNVASSVPGQAGQERGPTASWECGWEVSNLTWSPVQGMLGVCGGRGFWGVQL